MDQEQIRALLEQVKGGSVAIDKAIDRLQHMPFEDLGFAKLDHHRTLRHGMPEVIFGQNKAPEHILGIAEKLLDRNPNLLATRVSQEAADLVRSRILDAEYFPLARVVRVWRDRKVLGKGKIAVVCAGTADLPVAEECRLTLEVMGNEVDAIADVGVAGIHRLLANLERLRQCRVVIAVAGMEGTLPTAIGGLVSAPVIGVPTSVGYGSHFHGLAPLLSMLNSCASNVTVVNIDNGFGAGYSASLMNRL
jgi:pyridinium-3,5-biscarboxylic acid mononucleotide synthase